MTLIVATSAGQGQSTTFEPNRSEVAMTFTISPDIRDRLEASLPVPAYSRAALAPVLEAMAAKYPGVSVGDENSLRLTLAELRRLADEEDVSLYGTAELFFAAA
jgi:hypothetical protein